MKAHPKYRWNRGTWLLYAVAVAAELAASTGVFVLAARGNPTAISLAVYLAFVLAGTAGTAGWLLWLHGPWRPSYREMMLKQEQETRHERDV
jgi:hypothetical protein